MSLFFALQICEQGCAALCMLALRKPENCNVIMEGGGALAALQAMKAHPREVAVQVFASERLIIYSGLALAAFTASLGFCPLLDKYQKVLSVLGMQCLNAGLPVSVTLM